MKTTITPIKRKLVQSQMPAPHQGFLGPDHTARAVIQVPYPDSDPFILLMDDMLDKQDDEPVGGPHPHAGFETVSLLLEGEIGDPVHKMKAGDLQMMTAGSGIIHTETIDTQTRMRLLQLWLNLPKQHRGATPRVQDLPAAQVPTISRDGVHIGVYSGTLAGISSPLLNYTPLIIADLKMDVDIITTLQIPASYTTFLYVLEGAVLVGEGDKMKMLMEGEVGWLDRFAEDAASELILESGKSGARIVLYAGQPQNDPIVSHGPFIGDTEADIKRLYTEFRQGKMEHISQVPDAQRILW
jgi:redox-sensitive bicupin YhaK (pirin superfamily)